MERDQATELVETFGVQELHFDAEDLSDQSGVIPTTISEVDLWLGLGVPKESIVDILRYVGSRDVIVLYAENPGTRKESSE